MTARLKRLTKNWWFGFWVCLFCSLVFACLGGFWLVGFGIFFFFKFTSLTKLFIGLLSFSKDSTTVNHKTIQLFLEELKCTSNWQHTIKSQKNVLVNTSNFQPLLWLIQTHFKTKNNSQDTSQFTSIQKTNITKGQFEMEKSQGIKILYLLLFPSFLLLFLFICLSNSHPLFCQLFFFFFLFQSQFLSLCFFPTSLFFNLENKAKQYSTSVFTIMIFYDFCNTYLHKDCMKQLKELQGQSYISASKFLQNQMISFGPLFTEPTSHKNTNYKCY